ncbi:ATP-binding cassette domain-containing protein [Variovorax terrae]|uniref:ATP-binding cassette domain-containing protein n=1 Tax=Variovorax terrae TaxID=2923278 RepID=A0A9X1VTJ6_9BURK|nr:ATP-binding cassette domain-containing protein [Variovorax terrae]MCJ0763651.1 ATP-binding cassette domain-containing protein [Variovorax terrae]
MQHQHCLHAEGYGVAFGDKVILAELDFALRAQAVTALLGPAGTGKSTLLRSLAGLNDGNPRFTAWGQIEYLGRPLSDSHRPALVKQNARLMMASTLQAVAELARPRLALGPAALRDWCADYVTAMGLPELADHLDQPTLELPTVQQRAVAILREAAAEPALLMVDEPTADLDEHDAHLLIDLLQRIAHTSALLLVVHNQRQARRAAQHMLLLAGGRIQEAGGMEDFLVAPQSDAGRQFVRTGSCALPAPGADPASLADDAPVPPPLPAAAQRALAQQQAPATQLPLQGQPDAVPASRGPRGFHWLVPGRLAGTPLPGVVQDIDRDLEALRRCGITRLITLTEHDLPQDALQRQGLNNLHLPVRDREPPSVAQIQMLLLRMDQLLRRGEVLAVHCLAGIGRTGTVLASWLVREGLTAAEALRRVRLIDPQYVQSAEQEVFLQQYEDAILRKII